VLDQETISCWLRAADAFALATMREGCCNAVIEALATGAPVITTPAGNNAHFVQDNRNGFVIPMRNVEACARALADALDRPWDPAAISSELSVGSWDDVAEDILEFFVQRLSNSSGAGGARTVK
jgi:teichuronic acid biosynthesis glycosyltransferase TuaC